MPHFALHILLASRVADAGVAAGPHGPAPDLGDPAPRNAFLHGAIGPDMGSYPGGERLLSLAAHVVRAGDVARALHATAETPEQRAFAAGWLTHMLGDVLVHPLINRAATELLEREQTAATPASHRHAHLRVELGLDARYVARYRWLRKTRLAPFFDGRTARWIAGAFGQVHGVEFEARAVLRSHHSVIRFQRPLLLLERLIAIGRGRAHPLRWLLRRAFPACHGLACRRLGPHSAIAGLLDPVRPPGPVVRSVDAMIADFPGMFAEFAELVLETRVNHSLDEGCIELPGQPTREGIEARRLLAARQAAQAARPGAVAATA